VEIERGVGFAEFGVFYAVAMAVEPTDENFPENIV
jgi:hypothetical protein